MKLPVRSERGWVQAWVVIKENKTQLDSAGYDRKQMADKLDGEKFGSGRFDIESHTVIWGGDNKDPAICRPSHQSPHFKNTLIYLQPFWFTRMSGTIITNIFHKDISFSKPSNVFFFALFCV